MLTIKDDSLRYYTISYAIFNQLSYLINSSGQMLSECLTEGLSACVTAAPGRGVGVVITPVMGKRRSVNLKNRETTQKIEKREEWRRQTDGWEQQSEWKSEFNVDQRTNAGFYCDSHTGHRL